MSTVTINDKAKPLLKEMADANGVSQREFVEALLHYAYSIHRRPGSWEACQPFDFAAYDNRTENGQFADRWF